MKVRRALLSVSDKTGIVDFARGLAELDIEILSTGGTASLLRSSGVQVIDVSSVTGYPEMMGGRVKTLHPKIHGGILGRRGTDDAVMAEHGIDPIDLVVVNLYPFRQTIADSWPDEIDDSQARQDWGWQHAYGLEQIVVDMLDQLSKTSSTHTSAM